MVFIFLVTIDDVNFVIISKAYKVIWKVDLTMKNNRITGGLVVILTVVIGLLLTTQWSSPISAAQQPSVQYQTHVQDYGWQNVVSDGQTSGTTGQGKRLEATTIQLGNQNAATSGSIQYQTQIQNIGWQNWVQDGALSGTQGQSLRLETIRIKLTGNIANSYNVYYRVHAQNFGWLGWASNGQDAGTVGYGYRLEALQIVLVPKGQPAPGDTTNPSYTRKPDPSIHYQTNVQNSGWQTSVADGATAGTMGQALRVEAFKANVSDLPDNMSGGVTYKAYVQNVG